jgi:hypothetical protein
MVFPCGRLSQNLLRADCFASFEQKSSTTRSGKASREDIGKIQSRDMVIAIRIAEAAGYKGLRTELVNAVIATLKAPSEFAAFSTALSNMGLKSEAFRVAKKAAEKIIFWEKQLTPQWRSIRKDYRSIRLWFML